MCPRSQLCARRSPARYRVRSMALLKITAYFVAELCGSPKLTLDEGNGLKSSGDTGQRWLQQLG